MIKFKYLWAVGKLYCTDNKMQFWIETDGYEVWVHSPDKQDEGTSNVILDTPLHPVHIKYLY